MSTHWFTADTHFGHRKIALYTKREFCFSASEKQELHAALLRQANASSRIRDEWKPSWEAVATMDDYLIDRINECVQPNDTLWHLGDFCFGPKGRMLEHARRYRDRINCKTIYLTWGNHDDHQIAPAFNRTYERYSLKWFGKNIVMSHYAQAVWDKSHRGAWMLYGHSHSTAEGWLDKFMPGRRSIDVGVDNAFKVLKEYRPFSFDELNQILSARTGVSIDHHKESENGE